MAFRPIERLPMEIEHYNLEMIKPETAIEMLAKNGIKMDREEAKKVLELLYFLVKLSVNQIVDTENSKI
ncbi:hypothetical protein SAMN04489864_1097 [Pedobacter insulae]|uniref:Uncharacterized protein n=2 Tax=Pedobacter insulae TaxID=414048 RepID=A0A1I2Z666_9SPHI|nr:hypothetical protein SAMN04489864_1097 [Pedobacter insulae]